MRRNNLLEICQKALEKAGCDVYMELVDRIGFSDTDGRHWEFSKTAFVHHPEGGQRCKSLKENERLRGLSLRIEEFEELSRSGHPCYVVYQGEGVRPASDVEVELWQENERLRGLLKRVANGAETAVIETTLLNEIESALEAKDASEGE